MTEQQIPKLVASLVEHQNAFSQLSNEDGQWAIQNTKEAVSLFVAALAGRAKQVVEKLLDWVGTVTVPATASKFIAREKFVVDTSDSAEVKISYLGDNFKRWFLDKTEEPMAEQVLRYAKLKKSSVDGPIIAELGGDAKAETTLTEFFAVLKQQGHGISGALLNNDWANIFYILDESGLLRAVRAYWRGGGWGVGADEVSCPRAWRGGNQVFSRKPSES